MTPKELRFFYITKVKSNANHYHISHTSIRWCYDRIHHLW